MKRFLLRNNQRIGIAPDELYFIGEQKMENILIRVLEYDANTIQEKTLASVESAVQFPSKDKVTWLNIDGIHDKEACEKIGMGFQFDNLVMSNVMDTLARPRLYEYEDYLFLSIKMLKLDKVLNEVNVENISLILTSNLLISFQESKGDVFDPIRDRLHKQSKRIRNSGADYLMFALLDIIIDNYLLVTTEFANKIEDLEEKIIKNPNEDVLEDIYDLKKELNYLRKNINPARDMILSLHKLESSLIKRKTYIHLKELVDNINHAVESTDNLRDILTDQLNIYHTIISTKLNDVMKFLTVFSVIFIPLTFIAGIYGTNFDNIPELHYKYGYYGMWVSFIIIVIGMLYYFKRKKWL